MPLALARRLLAALCFSAPLLAGAQSMGGSSITPLPAPLSLVGMGPVQCWSVVSGGNGHCYAYVNQAVDWATALALASDTSHEGVTGHLATLTSASENAFAALTVAQGALAWVAGSDDGAEGSWTWRAGPEAGTAIGYTNWAPGEPNNCCNGENFLHVNWGPGGTWNDHGGPGNPGQVNGFLVEFSAVPVPEPMTGLLLMSGLAALGWLRARRGA